jgi:hypothetical protein
VNELVKLRAGEITAGFSLASTTTALVSLNQVLTALSATLGILAGIISIVISIRRAYRERDK